MLVGFRKSNKLCHLVQKVLFTPPSRNLNLVEFQSKLLLEKHGLKVQKFCLVNKDIGFNDFNKFTSKEYVIKAQILAGGRGKGVFDNGFKGGVRITQDKAKAKEYVTKMLGNRLITKQTPKEGILVKEVMVAASVNILKETYVCLLLDRQSNGPVFIISSEGGIDIESVAKDSPSLIKTIPVDIFEGPTEQTLNDIVHTLQLKKELHQKAKQQLSLLWKMYVKVDALQVEINPLAATDTEEIICIDAKFSFDDNAKFRQKDIFSLEDYSDIDAQENEATKHNLNYIKLNGNIGCLVNGAGLAMATMDIIKLFGGEPANFLDIGGGVSEDQIKKAIEILTTDPKVKVILINIFGGIVNCASIAKGICNAAKSLTTPTVVRLEGTGAAEARKILSEAKLKIETADGFEEAVRKSIALLHNTK